MSCQIVRHQAAGLRTDGSIECCGDRLEGQLYSSGEITTPPDGLFRSRPTRWSGTFAPCDRPGGA